MSLEPLVRHLRGKSVPDHRHAWWSLFGGLTLFFFAVQVISGLLLSLHYQPSVETAYRGVTRIVEEVPFGWFVRSAHVWSSHLLILSALVHLGAKYFLGSYRHPHASAWRSGVVLILILLASAFTGHLLPWEMPGYYATQIGTDIVAAAPVVGPFLAGVLRGGSGYVDGTTLSRIYSLHAAVLPFIAFIVLLWYAAAHLFGEPSVPEGIVVRRWIPFYPDYLYRIALVSLAGLMLLFTLTTWFPVLQRPAADPLVAPPTGIRPEWYFLPVYQAIRLLPGAIGGFATEMLIDIVLLVIVAGLFALPSIDRDKGRIIRIVGTVFLLYAICAILWTYLVL